MPRTDLYLKVEVETEDEEPKKVAAEICRLILRVYGVRTAELTHWVTSGD